MLVRKPGRVDFGGSKSCSPASNLVLLALRASGIQGDKEVAEGRTALSSSSAARRTFASAERVPTMRLRMPSAFMAGEASARDHGSWRSGCVKGAGAHRRWGGRARMQRMQLRGLFLRGGLALRPGPGERWTAVEGCGCLLDGKKRSVADEHGIEGGVEGGWLFSAYVRAALQHLQRRAAASGCGDL